LVVTYDDSNHSN